MYEENVGLCDQKVRVKHLRMKCTLGGDYLEE